MDLTLEGLDREPMVSINKSAEGVCSLQHTGTDVAQLHQLLKMKVDWGQAHEYFSSPNRAGFEGTGNPEAGVPLHLAE
jgi:hypothetical protein